MIRRRNGFLRTFRGLSEKFHSCLEFSCASVIGFEEVGSLNDVMPMECETPSVQDIISADQTTKMAESKTVQRGWRTESAGTGCISCVLRLGLFVFFLFYGSHFFRGVAVARELQFTTGEWPPYASQSLAGDGLIPELVNRAFGLVGHSVSYSFFPWKRSYELARQGRFQGSVIWQPTPERAKHFIFSKPVMKNQTAFYHRKSLSFSWQSLEDLVGYKVGVTRGYAYRPGFREEAKRLGIRLEESDTDLVNLRLLLEGRIDLFPMNIDVAQYLLSKNFTEQKVRSLTYEKHILSEASLVVMFPRSLPDSEQLAEDFDRGLDLLQKSPAWKDLAPHPYHKRRLLVGISRWPPRQIITQDGIGGIDPVILRRLSKRTGLDFHFVECPWSRCLEMGRKGELDLLASMNLTGERKKHFVSLGPSYQRERVAIYTRKDFPMQVNRYEDLAHKSIATLRGSAYFPRFDADTTLHKIPVDRELQQFRMLKAGRVELVIGNEETSDYAIKKGGFDGVFVKTPFVVQGLPVYFGMSKKSRMLSERFLLAGEIEKMVEADEIAEITDRFFMELLPGD